MKTKNRADGILKCIEDVSGTAHDAVDYVGYANYAGRQTEAHQKVAEAARNAEKYTDALIAWFEDRDNQDLELTMKQVAYVLLNFDPKVECYHMHVKLHSQLYRPATMYEPAEYIKWGVCEDCGENLGEDYPEVATVKD